MKISNKFYISNYLDEKLIEENIQLKKKITGYALLIAENNNQIFQIIKAKKIDYSNETLILVGIFKDKQEVFLYIKDIFQNAINHSIEIGEVKNYYSKVGWKYA